MKHAIVVVITLMSCLVLQAEQAAPPKGERTRRAESNGKPLSEQVRSDDQRLVLEINAFPPLLVRSRGEEVEFLTDISDVVLVGRVVSKRPEITRLGNWIETAVVMAIEETLKSNDRLVLAEGNRVMFRLSGGTMQVNHATVEAIVPWTREVESGRRYLIFGTVLEDGQLLAPPAAIYEEADDGTMRWLMRHDDPFERDGIERLSLQQLRFNVQQRVSRPR